jgi:hypothetical protein
MMYLPCPPCSVRTIFPGLRELLTDTLLEGGCVIYLFLFFYGLLIFLFFLIYHNEFVRMNKHWFS